MALQTEGEFRRTASGQELDDLEELERGASDAEIVHGVSPSLTIAVDTYEEGPWRWSMYVRGRAVRMLNDPSRDVSVAISSGAVLFGGEISEWMWHASGGIQLQYTGKK